jgi:tetratricopeptide (TPR) repeat protein
MLARGFDPWRYLVAFDRDATLKKAEKLLRQGRLEPAIAEYLRVVEEYPRDWSTANTLGDLYARAGQAGQAVGQYTRIAQHFVDEGFYPKAAALYKKVLKLQPQDETTQIQLADISARQGLLADAKAYLNAIAARRRAKGDRRGAAEIVVRLGTIDPVDFEARLNAARTLEEMGEEEEAGQRFKALHDDLLEKGRTDEAIDALKEFVRINPLEREARSMLARAALEKGDLAGAREFLDEDSAGEDPVLLFPLAEIELRSGEVARGRALLARLLTVDPERRSAVNQLGWSFVGHDTDAAFACIEPSVDAAAAVQQYEEAAAKLQEFVAKVPNQIPALLKLVEVCVDGGLEQPMYVAQEQLTDAYLASNQPAEARVIAEDLVAREPWESQHIDRFRRALMMLRVPDPDTLIAERLSGQAPFMARDPFFEEPQPAPAPEPAPAEPEVAHEATTPEAASEAEGASAYSGALPAEISRYDEPAESSSHTDSPLPVSTSPSSGRGGHGGHGGHDEIDLTGALGGLEAPERTGAPTGDASAARAGQLDQAFAKIRTDAGADGEASQHMTLARTYVEIGMTDEAIGSLHIAVRAPSHRFEASALLGRVYERRGDFAQAIEWFERAAEAQAPNVDAARELLYDLGVLLDGAGETSRALAVFLELQSEAGDYRDVPPRIDRLSRVQTGG